MTIEFKLNTSNKESKKGFALIIYVYLNKIKNLNLILRVMGHSQQRTGVQHTGGTVEPNQSNLPSYKQFKMKKILILFLVFLSYKSFCQERATDLNNKMNVIVYLAPKLKTSNYLIYSAYNNYMVINKLDNKYKVFYISSFLNVKTQLIQYKLTQTKQIKTNSILEKIFKKNNFTSLGNEKTGDRYLFFCLVLNGFIEFNFN